MHTATALPHRTPATVAKPTSLTSNAESPNSRRKIVVSAQASQLVPPLPPLNLTSSTNENSLAGAQRNSANGKTRSFGNVYAPSRGAMKPSSVPSQRRASPYPPLTSLLPRLLPATQNRPPPKHPPSPPFHFLLHPHTPLWQTAQSLSHAILWTCPLVQHSLPFPPARHSSTHQSILFT